MADAMTIHHGTCHGTAMARHMDALLWAAVAGLSLDMFNYSPWILMAMDTMTFHEAAHDTAIGLLCAFTALPWPCRALGMGLP